MFKLIEAKWHKLWSIRIAGACAFVAGTWPLVPDNLRDSLPDSVKATFAALAFGSIIVARLVPQPKSIGTPDGQ